jgi:putative FmdB family regulatory protein
MPLYEYRCDKCQVVTTVYRKVEHRDIVPRCDCGTMMQREMSRGVVGKVEAEYFHPGFGEVVRSKQHYKELQRKHQTRDMEGSDYSAIQEQLKRGKKHTPITSTDKDYQEAANKYGLVNN